MTRDTQDFPDNDVPRQSGPYVPGEQQTWSVFTQNHSNKLGYSFFLRN